MRPSQTRSLLIIAPAMIALAGMTGATTTAAASKACAVRNVTDATTFTDPQTAVDAASKGDKLELRGVCPGPVIIERSITITGKVRNGVAPVITGQESVRGVQILAGRTVVLKNLAVASGDAADDDEQGHGGGILNAGTLTLTGVSVHDNTAKEGAGVYNTGVLTVNGASRIFGNRAQVGGGIWSSGPVTVSGTSAIHGNEAVYSGGGIDHGSEAGPRPLLTVRDDAEVRGNKAVEGSGIAVWSGVLVMRDRAVVRGNRGVDDTSGQGAVFLANGKMTMLGLASVRGNTGYYTGGIQLGYRVNRGPSSLTMRGSSSVSGNQGSVAGVNIRDGSFTMLDSSRVRGHRTDLDAVIQVMNLDLDEGSSFTMKGASRVNDNAVGPTYGAVLRITCPGDVAPTLTGLKGRVVHNTPRNVVTECS